MWLLSCSTDLFDGRRIWLRPGTSHLLGRTSARQDGVRNQYVEHASVSRKHLYLNVAAVQAGDGMKLLTKSTVTVIDGSKTGTYINGHRMPKEEQTRVLDQDKYEIRLGTAPAVFTLEWHPVVLSFTSGITKAARAKGTALVEERQKLEALDIKLATEYVPNRTTHAIAKKRNTATVLQALLHGKWVITGSYVDALVEACKHTAVDEHGSPGLSALETDFDGNWPKEERHICPAGPDQKIQTDEELRPNPQRANLFEGFTFVFIDGGQFKTLQPVVNSGSGKAFCYDFENGKSTTEDIVDYVKQLAGRKGPEQYWLSQDAGPGGIVIVRPAQGNPAREDSVLYELDIALDQRSIEQSEFLDVILSLDTEMLRQPLKRIPESDHVEQRPPLSSSFPDPPSAARESFRTVDSHRVRKPALTPEPGSSHAYEQSAVQQEQSQAPTTGRRRRFVTQNRFKGFDDFDESQMEPQASLGPSQQDSRSLTQRMDMDKRSNTPSGTQKRPAPFEEEEEQEETEEQRHERMFPGQAAYKRQKTEALKSGGKGKVEKGPAMEPAKSGKEPLKGQGKKGKEGATALKARMIAEREAEEERYRKAKEADEATRHIDSDDIPQLQHEPVLFDLPVRPPRPQTTVSDNPAWSGRPNYKKFRRKGTERPRVEAPTVLIALEEVPSKGHGLGDEYWLENGDMHAKHRRKERSQAQSQAQSPSTAVDASAASIRGDEGHARGAVDEDERTAFRRRVQRSREQDEQEEVTDAMWQGRASGSSQSTLGTLSQKKAAQKRQATTQLGSGPVKKARQATVHIGDDDGDDPKAFRRKRR